MPRVPNIVATPDVPLRTGATRRVMGVPTPDFPMADPAMPQQIGRALRQVGRSVEEGAATIAAAEERQRRARETVKTLDASTNGIQELDAWYGEQQRQPDYEQLPERLRQKAQELLAQYGAGLSPQAKAAFQSRFLPHVEGMHRSAIAWVDKRGVVHAEATRTNLNAIHTRKAIEAGSPEEKDFNRLALQTGLTSLADAGYYDHEAIKEDLRKFDDTVAMTEAELEVRRNPALAGQMIQRRLQGTSGGPIFDAVPEAALPDLQTKSLQWSNAQTTQERENIRWLESRTKEQQATQERALHGAILQFDSTPENASILRDFQTEITNRAAELGDEGAMRLQALVRGRLDKALTPEPETEDQELVREVSAMIYEARTPEALQQITTVVLDHKHAFKTSTFDGFLGRLEDRRKKNHYTNDDTYADGVTIINNAARIPGLTSFDGIKLPDDIETGRRLALEAFDTKMQELSRQDIGVMRTEARKWAYTYRDMFLPLEKTYTKLPGRLKDVKDEKEAAKILKEMRDGGAPPEVVKQMIRLWEEKNKRPLTPSSP